MGAFSGPVHADTVWTGNIASGGSIELLYTGTIPAAPNNFYSATANANPTGLPGSNCFYQSCFFPPRDTFFTLWTVSTSVTINDHFFNVTNSNCNSPDSCITLPPYGGFSGGTLDSPLFVISVGQLNAIACSTTFVSSGTITGSQSCVGPTTGYVSLTLDIRQGDGEFEVVTPLPVSLPLFASGLGALGLLGWRRKRKVLSLSL
jgi:hypothetical protein